jgi:hypothetical protein
VTNPCEWTLTGVGRAAEVGMMRTAAFTYTQPWSSVGHRCSSPNTEAHFLMDTWTLCLEYPWRWDNKALEHPGCMSSELRKSAKGHEHSQ